MKTTEKSQPVIFEDIENRIIDLRGESSCKPSAMGNAVFTLPNVSMSRTQNKLA